MARSDRVGRIVLATLLLGACADAPPGDTLCTPLFDGVTFAGWTPLGDADFDIEMDEAGSPLIAGRAVYGIPNSFLRTDSVYGDFDLSLSFRVDSGFNSGVQIRSAVAQDTIRFERHQAGNGRVRKQVTLPGRVFGYQVEIDPTPRGWTGQIFDEAARGWLQTFSGDVQPRAIVPDAWHALRIRAVGDSVLTWLDGESVATLVDDRSSEGFIALQVHAVSDASHAGRTVRFRDLTLCEP